MSKIPVILFFALCCHYEALTCEEVQAISFLDSIKKRKLAEQADEEIIKRLSQNLPEGGGYYVGSQFQRGLFYYGINFHKLFKDDENPDKSFFWEELSRLGRSGKVLDLGCGDAVLAIDLYSTKLNIENEFTMGNCLFRYWPKRAPKGRDRLEIPEEQLAESKNLFDYFSRVLLHIRANPPMYVGITSLGISERYVRAHLDVFSNPRVKVFAGQLFSQVPPQEILISGDRFDVITDNHGVITYSKTLDEDLTKIFSLLKVGGKLFVKTDYCYANLLNDYLGQIDGIKVIYSFQFKTTNIIIEKIKEQVSVPIEVKNLLEAYENRRRTLGPRHKDL